MKVVVALLVVAVALTGLSLWRTIEVVETLAVEIGKVRQEAREAQRDADDLRAEVTEVIDVFMAATWPTGIEEIDTRVEALERDIANLDSQFGSRPPLYSGTTIWSEIVALDRRSDEVEQQVGIGSFHVQRFTNLWEEVDRLDGCVSQISQALRTGQPPFLFRC